MRFSVGFERLGRASIVCGVLAGGALGVGAYLVVGQEARAATGMSVVDRLEAKEEIRQQLVLYGLLAQGDGASPRDTNALSDRILDADVVSDQYFSDGSQAFPTIRGREATKVHSQPVQETRTVGRQHYTLGIYFDELTPTTAKTRSQHIYLHVMKNVPQPGCAADCAGRVKYLQMNNYFDTWRKTQQGWLKVKTVIRTIAPE